MENRILDMGYQLDNEKDLVFSCHFDQIINASHNIIDLIGERDFVKVRIDGIFINWFIYNIKEAMPILTQPLDGFEKSRNHYALSRFI